ncbi:hypothetical protein ACTD5D_32905 [Nocardia takedensis]
MTPRFDADHRCHGDLRLLFRASITASARWMSANAVEFSQQPGAA